MNTDDTVAKLQSIETTIATADADGIRARWHSGRLLVELREGKKQLPHGLRAQLRQALGVSNSDITQRMRLAEQYPSEDELDTAVTTFRSWTAIREQFKSQKPRRKQPRAEEKPPAEHLRRVLTLLSDAYDTLENLEQADLCEDDLDLLKSCLKQSSDNTKTLKWYLDTPEVLDIKRRQDEREAEAAALVQQYATRRRDAETTVEALDDMASKAVALAAPRSRAVDFSQPSLPVARKWRELVEEHLDHNIDPVVAHTQAMQTLLVEGVRA